MTPDHIRDLLIDILIPVTSILVPTLISVSLYRAERRAAAADRARERRLEAGAEIAKALAPLATFDATSENLKPIMTEARGRITIYRAWTTPGDIVGEWLPLRFRELMKIWGTTLGSFDPRGMPVGAVMDAQLPAHASAADMVEKFTGWLAGHVTTEQVREDGARILRDNPDLATPI
ncbi:hypothetical protein ACNPNP_08820 [Microbacterium sp. AGC85]